MKTLIVYAHPWEKSFNHHVLTKTTELLEQQGDEIDLIDLHADNFDPVFHAEGLKLFNQGQYHDKMAEGYAERLKRCDRVVFIFPIWWYGPPAILKGFFDKVFLNNHTYSQENKGEMTGLLKTKTAIALTTANIDEFTMTEYLGNPVKTLYLGGIMETCGVEDSDWIHCGTVQDQKSREKFLNKIDKYFS